MYKNIITLTFSILPLLVSSQIKIGGLDENIADHAILQFGDITDGTKLNPGKKGLLLPTILTSEVALKNENEGTIMYDIISGEVKLLTKQKIDLATGNPITPVLELKSLTTGGNGIKHYNIFLNRNRGILPANLDQDLIDENEIDQSNNPSLLLKTIADNYENEMSNSVIIGSETSNSDGVLIMEKEAHGLLLPRVYEPHKNIVNPDAGVVCYDTATKMIAFFDGKLWHYWY